MSKKIYNDNNVTQYCTFTLEKFDLSNIKQDHNKSLAVGEVECINR